MWANPHLYPTVLLAYRAVIGGPEIVTHFNLSLPIALEAACNTGCGSMYPGASPGLLLSRS